MKKARFLISLLLVVSIIILLSCYFGGQNNYITRLEESEIFDNSYDTIIPQTKVYEFAKAHLDAGDKNKVAIVGYDGGRADCLFALLNINTIMYHGDEELISDISIFSGAGYAREYGSVYLAYAGGPKGSSLQYTFTMPGWTSILTGKWADEHGVTKNGKVISASTPTILKEYALLGKQASFYARWQPYFDSLYKAEFDQEIYSSIRTYTDKETYEQMLFSMENGDDLIFGIYDDIDYNGHKADFSLKKWSYVKAVIDTDRYAFGLIEAANQREELYGENWLIIMASDHGGHLKNHGTQMMYDRLTFIALSKKIEI